MFTYHTSDHRSKGVRESIFVARIGSTVSLDCGETSGDVEWIRVPRLPGNGSSYGRVLLLQPMLSEHLGRYACVDMSRRRVTLQRWLLRDDAPRLWRAYKESTRIAIATSLFTAEFLILATICNYSINDIE